MTNVQTIQALTDKNTQHTPVKVYQGGYFSMLTFMWQMIGRNNNVLNIYIYIFFNFQIKTYNIDIL